MTREGRVVFVHAVMMSSIVYHLMALDLDPWFLQAVDKLRRGFLWAPSGEANGGCCAVAWNLVCQPKALGGLDSTTCAISTWLCARGGYDFRERIIPSLGPALTWRWVTPHGTFSTLRCR
jgi:hypothetical protein